MVKPYGLANLRWFSQSAYGLANQQLCCFKISQNLKKNWRTRLRTVDEYEPCVFVTGNRAKIDIADHFHFLHFQRF